MLIVSSWPMLLIMENINVVIWTYSKHGLCI